MGGVSQNAVVKSQINGSIDDLENSTIADDGTNVTIGISTTAAFNIPGDVRLREYDSAGLAYLQARNGNSNRDIGLRLRTQKAGTSTPDVTEAVTIDKDGQVGIGSAAPSCALDVVGTVKASAALVKSNSTTAVQVQKSDGTSVLNVDTTNSRVGIGSTSPGAKLEVLENSEGTGQKIIFSGKTDASTKKPAIQLSDVVNTRSVLGLMTGDIAVDFGGAVGIGTTEPLGQLEVKQPFSNGNCPVLVLDQQDTAQPFIQFKPATIYADKTAVNEYLMVKTDNVIRYIKLYS